MRPMRIAAIALRSKSLGLRCSWRSAGNCRRSSRKDCPMTDKTKPYTFRGFILPEHLRESLDTYVETGRPTGDFLRAVINNDLKDAVARADTENLHIIPAIVGYLSNECQTGSWGHARAWEEW